MSRTFNTILVPVDFSPYATEALLYAASIAEPFSSSLLLLHVIAQDTKVYATQRHLERRGMPHRVFPFSALTPRCWRNLRRRWMP